MTLFQNHNYNLMVFYVLYKTYHFSKSIWTTENNWEMLSGYVISSILTELSVGPNGLNKIIFIVLVLIHGKLQVAPFYVKIAYVSYML